MPSTLQCLLDAHHSSQFAKHNVHRYPFFSSNNQNLGVEAVEPSTN